MLKKFGQQVRLQILNKERELIFSAEGLRVDFHIKILSGFNRAKISIFNLSNSTIREITTGERYVKISTRLHDQSWKELSYDFYVNNAMSVKRVPNQITELYCIDSLKKDFTMKQANVTLRNPTLERYCQALAKDKEVEVHFRFIGFPTNLLEYKPVVPEAVWSGSIEGALAKLGKSYGFKHFIEGNVITCQFIPLDRNQSLTDQNEKEYMVLEDVNMRSTPKIGVAKLEIDSVLDFNIRSGTMLDTSDLVTAETGLGFDYLTIDRGALDSSVSGVAKFLTLVVEHRGSNYTKEWNTTAMAVKAAKGTKTPTYGWYGN